MPPRAGEHGISSCAWYASPLYLHSRRPADRFLIHPQLFRATGQTLTLAFGFKKGSCASSQTQLYAAFFVTGLIHTACDAMVGKEYIGIRMKFFMANAVAITLEDTVIAAARRIGIGREGPARWMKCIGYSWVVVWFYHACQPEMHYILPLGAAEEEVLPFSFVRSYAPAFM